MRSHRRDRHKQGRGEGRHQKMMLVSLGRRRADGGHTQDINMKYR